MVDLMSLDPSFAVRQNCYRDDPARRLGSLPSLLPQDRSWLPKALNRAVDFLGTKEEHSHRAAMERDMPPSPQSDMQEGDGLEAAVDQAIAACGGDVRAAIRALIVANEYLETEVGELMKAVSHAYARGRFQTYSG
jgi:hypothetical protein